MVNKKSRKERILIICLTCILFIAIIGGGTLSQINKRAVTENEITSGEITVKLLNLSSTGDIMPKLITHIVPGDTLDNVVTVKNTCNYDEYIRVTLDKTITDGDEEQTVLDSSKAHFLFNEKDWTYKDGYYYYNNILQVGQTSECLYDGIFLDTTMGNEYKLATLQVDIVVEAVQSINNGETVLEAEGWEVVAK